MGIEFYSAMLATKLHESSSDAVCAEVRNYTGDHLYNFGELYFAALFRVFFLNEELYASTFCTYFLQQAEERGACGDVGFCAHLLKLLDVCPSLDRTDIELKKAVIGRFHDHAVPDMQSLATTLTENNLTGAAGGAKSDLKQILHEL